MEKFLKGDFLPWWAKGFYLLFIGMPIFFSLFCFFILVFAWPMAGAFLIVIAFPTITGAIVYVFGLILWLIFAGEYL